MNENLGFDPALSPVVIHLLKGVLYRDQQPKLWQTLLTLEARVRDYLKVLGVELDLDDAEGYAFIRQTEPSPDDDKPLPRLVTRRPLSYPVSLLLVLLRKRLLEGDASGGELRSVVTRAELIESMRVFLPEGSNEVRIIDQIDSHIAKAVDLGFLRELDEAGTFEIRRILKAFVDAQWMSQFNEKLQGYADHAITRS